MPAIEQLLQVYQDLAFWHERQGQAQLRDRFLILAADAAMTAGRDGEAERIRLRLLDVNPHHMLKPFATFAEALRSPDVQNYVEDLRQSYPPEEALALWKSKLGSATPHETAPSPPETIPLQPLPPTMAVIDIDNPPAGAPPAFWGQDREKQEARQRAAPPKPTIAPKPAARAPAESPPKSAARPPAEPPKPARPATRAPQPPTAARPATRATSEPGPKPVLPYNPQETYPLKPESRPRPGAKAPQPAPEAPAGSWVASLLFGVLLLGGAALGVFTLARPFLPPQWLP
jgi:hypothetical protein